MLRRWFFTWMSRQIKIRWCFVLRLPLTDILNTSKQGYRHQGVIGYKVTGPWCLIRLVSRAFQFQDALTFFCTLFHTIKHLQSALGCGNKHLGFHDSWMIPTEFCTD